MGYFPFFIEIGGKKCVVAGGGAAALRRINTLVKFGPQITVIAPAIMSEISSMDGVTCIARPFEDSDIEGAFMVVAATDDLLTNMRIAELCKEKNIPEIVTLSQDSDRMEESDETQAMLKQLYRMINRLGPLEKSIILLYLEEKSYEEIAEITGLTVTNVATKISRIKDKLRKMNKEE